MPTSLRKYLILFTLFINLAASLPAIDVYQPWLHSKDRVALLWQNLHSGAVKLETGSEQAFLGSLLDLLDIPVESQVLVFSKTSLQNNLISPGTPRAIYYNEDCYIGWVPGGMIEIIAVNPKGEPQFYTLDGPTAAGKAPLLLPSEQCFSCHETTRTNRVKGPLVRSVYTDAQGQPLLRHGSFVTTPASPLTERWGGWYVTGQHGADLHMGNVTATEVGDEVTLPKTAGANWMDLKQKLPKGVYLTHTSDIVALMLLEHQCAVQNAFTAGAKATLEAMERQRGIQDAFGEIATDVPQGSARKVIQHHAELILDEMLFKNEYPLQEGGIEGSPAFQDAFRKGRICSSSGRSLKDFQLGARLFKYRCSYMIYSTAFAALPDVLKSEIFHQLTGHLTTADNRDATDDAAVLSTSEREHIRDILLETQADYARWFKTHSDLVK